MSILVTSRANQDRKRAGNLWPRAPKAIGDAVQNQRMNAGIEQDDFEQCCAPPGRAATRSRRRSRTARQGICGSDGAARRRVERAHGAPPTCAARRSSFAARRQANELAVALAAVSGPEHALDVIAAARRRIAIDIDAKLGAFLLSAASPECLASTMRIAASEPRRIEPLIGARILQQAPAT